MAPGEEEGRSLERGASEGEGYDEDGEDRDMWFPSSKDCTCCKGYIYACEEPICADIGKCHCALTNDDLEGADEHEATGEIGDAELDAYAASH